MDNYIGGEWIGTGTAREVCSPWDGRVVGTVAVADAAAMDRAIACAADSFAQTRALSAAERHAILRDIHDRIAARREEFARGITDESGKTIRDARAEVDRALLVFSLAADEARHQGGELLPLDLNPASQGRWGITRRFPCGPVGAITPFNFPLNLVAHKVAPALAVGNPVVLKPAEKTPLTALRLAEVIHETAWPKGAFSALVTAPELGGVFATDDRIKALSFTGSARVGWALKEKATRKRVTLELGGNAAVIVHGDADIEDAVTRCVPGAFANAGQVCISVQRIYVHRPVWEQFNHAFVEKASQLKRGDPGRETTDLGPMITEEAADRAENRANAALQAGAKILLVVQRSGALLGPIALTNTRPDMAVVCEEVFAPIVALEPYDDFADALRQVNDSPFGLQAGVFTRDMGRIWQAFETLTVGGVIANDVPQYRVDNMPYGGEKDSGFGREGVRYAMDEMTELRLLALRFPG